MYRRIFVAIDDSATSQCALDHALQLAAEQHARVRVVHAIESIQHLAMSLAGGYPVDMDGFTESMRNDGARILARANARAAAAQLEAETALLEGTEPMDRTARLLARDAKHWDADLVVLGTHGRTGVDRMVLGSVAESLIRLTEIPVLLVHAK